MNQVDLHTHTTASDGVHSPSDNVAMAKRAGLSAVAITDHDTVAGIAEAKEAGRSLGMEIVPGVEVSTAFGDRDIHILGYYIDDGDPVFLQRLSSLREVRDRRNEGIVARLNELGIPLTMAQVEDAAGAGRGGDETVGRPHIAEALVRIGAVSTIQEAFDKYLAKGKAAYVHPPRITPEEAIAWIHEAGGTAVVAHPGLYGEDKKVASLLGSGGADGLEAYHSDHSPEQERHYVKMALKHGKLITGGSDFHGERKGHLYHGPIGHRTVGTCILARLRERSEKPDHRDPGAPSDS